MRTIRYKLLEYFENGTVQLFNLRDDMGEQNDLSKIEGRKAKELTAKLHQWRKDVDAQMMPPNPDYDIALDPWSGTTPFRPGPKAASKPSRQKQIPSSKLPWCGVGKGGVRGFQRSPMSKNLPVEASRFPFWNLKIILYDLSCSGVSMVFDVEILPVVGCRRTRNHTST